MCQNFRCYCRVVLFYDKTRWCEDCLREYLELIHAGHKQARLFTKTPGQAW